MKRILFAVLFVMSGVLTANAGDDPLPKPDVLGEESVSITEKLSARYDTIIVRDFSTEGAEIVNMDDDEKAKLAEAKPEVVKLLTENIVKYLKQDTQFKKVASNTTPSGNAIILEGKFTKFNAGHGAAKVFLGFFAPPSTKTNISVSGRLIDAKTGKELASFSDTRSGGEGSQLGFVGHVFKVQAKDEGEEIANFVTKLY